MNFMAVVFLLAAGVDSESAPPPVLLEAPALEATAPNAPAEPASAATTTTELPNDPAIEQGGPRAVPALAEDEGANAAYTKCLTTARVDTPAVLSACFERVATAYPDTLAAVRARANVSLLEAERGVEKSSWLPPGRLELVGVAGIFGVWNAIAGGVIVANNVDEGNPGALLIGVSVASLALGVGFGVGGAAIGDALKLDEGASRLVASGLIWGTNMGIGLLPVVFDLAPEANVAVPILTVVGGGWVGGLGALALTNGLRLDVPAVSIMNSGGIWGSVVGGLIMANLSNAQVEAPAAYSAAYLGSNVAGLVGGALLSQVVDVSWGETLIFDLGAVIGGSVLGLGTAGILVASNTGELYGTQLMTGAIGLGVLGGYGIGMLTLGLLREDTKPLLRSFGVTPTTPKPMAVLDNVGKPVAMMPLLALAL